MSTSACIRFYFVPAVASLCYENGQIIGHVLALVIMAKWANTSSPTSSVVWQLAKVDKEKKEIAWCTINNRDE